MAETRLNYANLRDFAKRIHELGVHYGDIYKDQLYDSFENKLKEAFQGDDATTAIGQLDALRDDFEAMEQTIEAYSKHLYRAADAYEETMGNLQKQAQNLTGNRH